MRYRPVTILALTVAAPAVAWTVAVPPTGAAAPTVRAARNATLNRTIVVSSTGRTLYHRVGERSGHVRCGSVCTRVWPPLTVPSAATRLVRGPGVTGVLGRFRRPDGRWQVTLRGLPLYRFVGDHAAGQAHGQRVAGIWFALAASMTRPPPSGSPPPAY